MESRRFVMIRSRVRDGLERTRALPFFPVVPLVPIALVVGNLFMVGLILWKVSRMEKAYR
jgi:hypothetical protein